MEGGREPKQTSSLSLLQVGHSRELTHTIIEADKAQASSRQGGDPGEPTVWSQSKGQQARVPGRADTAVQVRRQEKTQSGREDSWEGQPFCSIRTFN